MNTECKKDSLHLKISKTKKCPFHKQALFCQVSLKYRKPKVMLQLYYSILLRCLKISQLNNLSLRRWNYIIHHTVLTAKTKYRLHKSLGSVKERKLFGEEAAYCVLLSWLVKNWSKSLLNLFYISKY